LRRLFEGCAVLGLEAPDAAVLERESSVVLAGSPEAALKIILTRGAGGGYAPGAGAALTRIVTRRPLPEGIRERRTRGIRVCLCRIRMGLNPDLAGIKHLNRLEQVLASREAQARHCEEGLLQSADGWLTEGTRTNLFVVVGGRLVTPPMDRCGVAGIMRGLILERAQALGLGIAQARLEPEVLAAATEIFVTNSLIGIWPVVHVLDACDRHLAVGQATRALIDDLEAAGELV
jgi:4-amino-4-deoxychorismate lyase